MEKLGGKQKGPNPELANRYLSYNLSHGLGYSRPYHEAYLRLPGLDQGAYLTVREIHPHFKLEVPHHWNWPPGDYVMRARVAARDQAPPEQRFIDFGVDPIGGRILGTHYVSGTMANPQVIEMPFRITGNQTGSTDGHAVKGSRTFYIKEKGVGDHYTQSNAVFDRAKGKNGVGPEFAIWVDWIEFEPASKPHEPLPPGSAALKVPLDDKAPAPEKEAVRDSLKGFCVEAFRGAAPPESYLDRLIRVYELRLQGGVKPGTALRETLATVLASPMFLYLAEPSVDLQKRPLTAPELAARLSYLLWGAPPDCELRELGVNGTLREPHVLRAQTERLLQDPRCAQFIHPFLDQWLGLERIDFFEVNRSLYPRFDQAVKLAARQEVYETFADLLARDGGLAHLLKSDSAVVNRVLADFYGIPGVSGDGFQRVLLPKDSPRGGLIARNLLFWPGHGKRLESGLGPEERGGLVNCPAAMRSATSLERLSEEQP